MSSSPGPAPARGPVAGGRVGLSEYTAQRLAELRARRAEADTTDSTYVKPAPAPRPLPTTTTSRTAACTAADGIARSAVAPTVNSASDVAANGVKAENTSGVISYNSYSSHRNAVTDAASLQTQSQSTTVSSPHHQHPQQQHQYVTVSSRSASSSRHESNIAVDKMTAQQVTAVYFYTNVKAVWASLEAMISNQIK